MESDFPQTIKQIRSRPKDRLSLFRALPPNLRAQAFFAVSRNIAYDIFSKLDNDEIVAVLEHLDPDEATDALQLFSAQRQKRLLESLNKESREAVKTLLQFDPQTAAGLMDLDYIQVDGEDTIAKVAKQFKVHEKRTGRLPVVLVLGSDGKLAGYLPGHELGFARPSDKAKKFIRRIATIQQDAPRDEVVEFFRSLPHAKAVVVGESGQIWGIIYSDDIMPLLREQEGKALYNFAGVLSEESVFDSADLKVKYRYKWLIINLATAFLASFVVSLFDKTISNYVLLAVYMPIIAGMGGNAATQTMAVMVRGIALKQIDAQNYFAVAKNEIIAGAANGLINGVIVGAVVMVFNREPVIGLVLAVAMVVNLVVAGFFGTIIPLAMSKLGKDPASSATIFITTATDVLGFLVFLGLAALLLP